MTKKYPYRFKTKEEFIKEYGNDWRSKRIDYYKFVLNMDYLFGTVFPYDINEFDDLPFLRSNSGNWGISWYMLIKNEPSVPSYKPKEKIIRIL